MESSTALAADGLLEMLSFGGDVLAFRRKSLRDHGKGSEVSFCALSFRRDSRSFSVRDRKTHPVLRDGSAETDLVHAAAAVDVQQRRKVPCVLLKRRKKRTSAFTYTLCSAEGKLHVEFALPYEMRENISILQGPTVVWSHESSVFYASSRTGGVKEVPVSMTVKFIGELPLYQRKLVIYGTRGDGRNTLYFVEEERSCDAACLVPDAYSSVIRCLMLLSAEEVRGSLTSEVLAATSTKQLVRFENGLPRDVCPLPHERPLNIQMIHTVKNDSLVVVTFSQGHVCAVWKDSFQVACCWTGVRLLLVDDFVGCGTDQMLLVFEDQDSSGELLSNFLLTDLCGITYSCGRSDGDVLNTPDAAQENFLLTVQALESRLQSGLNFLEDLQRDVEVKDRLIRQSLVALTDLISSREHVIFPPEQLLSSQSVSNALSMKLRLLKSTLCSDWSAGAEGLVSLWDDDDDDEDVLDDGMQTERAEALLKVDRIWQRVIGQSLIVGVVLRATNNTSVVNMSASVVVDSCHAVANTKILRFPASVAHGPSAAKKIRRSDCSADGDTSRLALVAVTDVAPLLTSGGVKCPIMLHYSTKESSGSPPRVSHYCGQISADLRDISTGKFHPRLLRDHKLNTEEAREDLLSLLAALDVWFFLVECSDHTLEDVQGWLRESLRAERLDVDPRFLADPSDVRLFRWEQKSPFRAVLSVRCRDDLRLLQFLHSLCDFLPASHHIQLLESPRSRGDLAQTLETEIRAVIQDVSSVLQCGEREMTGQRETDASLEPLQRLREEWQTERGRYHDRLRPLVDATAYSRLVERLIDAQLDADEVALMEASRL